uniref:Uncharacterized protein n=1 Tax=Loa loa TaxID=7209 RepID=A0A1I7VH19_LOALO
MVTITSHQFTSHQLLRYETLKSHWQQCLQEYVDMKAVFNIYKNRKWNEMYEERERHLKSVRIRCYQRYKGNLNIARLLCKRFISNGSSVKSANGAENSPQIVEYNTTHLLHYSVWRCDVAHEYGVISARPVKRVLVYGRQSTTSRIFRSIQNQN